MPGSGSHHAQAALEVRVSARGGVTEAERALAETRLRQVAAHAGRPVRLARLGIAREARAVSATATLELGGVVVRAGAEGRDVEGALALLEERLVRRLPLLAA